MFILKTDMLIGYVSVNVENQKLLTVLNYAARNVKMFGSTKRTECLEQASAENSSSTSLLTEMLDDLQEDSMKRKSEADTL